MILDVGFGKEKGEAYRREAAAQESEKETSS